MGFRIGFQADANDNVLNFVGEDLRSITGITNTLSTFDYA